MTVSSDDQREDPLVLLQDRVFTRLSETLRRTQPDAAAAFDAHPPRSSPNAMATFVARHNLRSVQPWAQLATRVLNVRLGLDELAATQALLARASNGREAWVLLQHSFVASASCLERVDALLKAASRGKKPVVGTDITDALTARVSKMRNSRALDELRNGAAHGLHAIPDGYGASPEKLLGWEFMALNGETGSEMLLDFYDRGWASYTRRVERARRFAVQVVALTLKVTTTLLDQIPEPPKN
ncbi:MAG: hypothetical protein WCL53_09980 [Chloroflexota bacterium]